MKIKKQTLQSLMLLVFPTILIIAGFSFSLQIFPIYAGASGYDHDPAYVYLFSGLTILDGHSPYHIDHPGTPLQVLIALVVLIQWVYLWVAGSVSEDVINSVLFKPKHYITTICLMLLILNACAVYYLKRHVFQSTANVKLALFCQSAPLVFWIVAPRIVYLSPEALLIFASVILLGLLAPIIAGSNEGQSNMPGKIPILAGIICGFGVAVKITFVPMLGLLLLLGTRSRMFRALKYTVITWMVCMLPILGSIVRMIDQYYSFTIHSGKYGAGKADFINIDAISDRMVDLIEAFPFFYSVLLVLVMVLILKVISVVVYKSPGYSAAVPSSYSHIVRLVDYIAPVTKSSINVPLVLVFVGFFQTFLVLKHPGAHYMIPVLPIAFLSVVWLVQLVGNKWRLDAVLLGLSCLLVVNSISTAFFDLRDSRLLINESMESVQAELDKYINPLVIGAYRCMLPECGLSFGVYFAPSLSHKTEHLLSNFYDYHIWSNMLNVPGEGWVDIDWINKDIAEGRDVFLVSPERYESLELFSLVTVVNTQAQSLYRVTGLISSES